MIEQVIPRNIGEFEGTIDPSIVDGDKIISLSLVVRLFILSVDNFLTIYSS